MKTRNNANSIHPIGNPEIALWRAVIDNALRGLKKQEDNDDWLRGKSRDFYIVCELADISPAALRKRIKYLMGESNVKQDNHSSGSI